MKETAIAVDIFHDTACPWCFIGIKNLFDALQQWQERPVKLQWHPFFLDNTIPREGVAFRTFLASRKGLGREELNWLFDYAQQRGKAVGVKINFDTIALAVNTELSHRLIALTPDDKKSAVVEAVYKAYFENGSNIGDIDVLVSIGEAAGMNCCELRKALSSDAALMQVSSEATLTRQKGITSVPFFIVNNLISIDGSHSVKVFIQAFNRASFLSLLKPPYWF
jgi:predicted DsbA family dithiol-disulfide isomerase